MSELALSARGLGKQYRLGARRENHRTLREQIVRSLTGPVRRLRQVVRGRSSVETDRHMWALRDVSFEVRVGEVVGVVGRNGAGKTTLLKVLSRIAEPTVGEAFLHGRVASLLEVGTGFHPELTGRENVYLNGAILGMRRSEIESKFDAIVAFAEIDEFLDTAVKHYSSGMYVRLAFAVAAHLDPEVLLVDEILAVGDAGFQRKCIASIRDSTSSGRTALVVSHNMAMIRSLCSRVLLLIDGELRADGDPDEILAQYHDSFGDPRSEYVNDAGHGGGAFVRRAFIADASGGYRNEVAVGEDFSIALDLGMAIPAIRRPWIAVRIHSWHGDLIAHVPNREAGYEFTDVTDGTRITCHIESPNLLPGQYFVGVVLSDANRNVHERLEHAFEFSVIPADVHGSGLLPRSDHGSVFLQSRWEALEVPSPRAVLDRSVS